MPVGVADAGRPIADAGRAGADWGASIDRATLGAADRWSAFFFVNISEYADGERRRPVADPKGT